MTAQLSKGPPSPPAVPSTWKCKRTTSLWEVESVSSSGASVKLKPSGGKNFGPEREMRVTTLRRDYEEIK